MVTNPEVSSVRDSDRILGMLGSKTAARHRGQGPVKGTPADHPLQPQPAWPTARCSAWRTFRDILRVKLIGVVPRAKGRAAGLQPGPAGGAPEGQRHRRAYMDVIEALSGRRGADAFTSRPRNPASSSACSGGAEAMSFLSFFLGERRRPPASPRSGCRSSWRTSVPAAAPRTRLPARSAARPDRGDQQSTSGSIPRTSRCTWSARTIWKCGVKIELPEKKAD